MVPYVSAPSVLAHANTIPVQKKRKLLPKDTTGASDHLPPELLPTTTDQQSDTDVAAAAAKKRLQYKMYQRRHRAKQREKAQLLDQQVKQLHLEITRLQHTQQLSVAAPCFTSRDTLAGKPAQIVREYFRLFEHGYSKESSTQRAFVRSAMASNVRGTHFQGVDELLLQWQLYARQFSTVHLVMHQMHVKLVDNLPVVNVSVTLALRLRKGHASRLFPCLSSHEHLLQELVRAAVTIHGSMRFGFDSAGCVDRLSSEMDFVGGYLRLLGSFDEVLRLVENATIHLSTGYISGGCETSQSLRHSSSDSQPLPRATGSPSRCHLAYILCEPSTTAEIQ